MLDLKFFRKSELASKGKFVAYENLYHRSTMILSSTTTGRPIAAITLVSGTPKTATLMTARPPPIDAKEDDAMSFFQGMLDQDGALFSFAVTNLCTKGHLMFQVFQVGSEMPVNEINCVEANSTYVIPCDQRSGKAMSIQSRKDKQDANKDQSIKDAEALHAANPEENKALVRFKVLLKPEVGQNDKMFEGGTAWKCQLGFVREEEEERRIYKGFGAAPNRDGIVLESGYWRGGSRGADMLEGSMGGEEVAFGFREMSMSRGGGRGMSMSRRGGNMRGARGHDSTSRGMPEMSRPLSAQKKKGAGFFGSAVPPTRSAGAPAPISSMPEPAVALYRGSPPLPQAQVMSLQLAEVPPVDYRSMSFGAREEKEVKEEEESGDGAAAMDWDGLGGSVDVGATTAVDLVYSGDKVQVKSRSVELNFSDELSSAPLIIGISLWRSMKVNKVPDILVWLKEQVDEAVQNEGKVLAKQIKQVFKSEFCVVLADEETPADSVIIQCGHACVHHSVVSKLDKCPLCRGYITATCLLASM